MKITEVQCLGKIISERRKKLGYTQQQVSDVTGLSTSFISDAEHGKTTLELGKVIKLINILGLDISVTARDESTI